MGIVLTAAALGIAAVHLRSGAVCVAIALLIPFVFATAAIVSAGSVSFTALALAILAYNCGMIATLGVSYAREAVAGA